ncbi:mycothiol synthase [Paenarthrobacter sp. Z7-10]|uniref:mycothiol synthase n=1 Tax=Paenarthrobacter sp. Z7-10 TaxID=2787635 RepID=UPI0022A985D8|nr:mycothiol synthase [Paenarthrobacter sp. Z7-10]MCZ2402129.1 mycothiol synthase [Paenarthrobacter sp. Z7-10]
MGGKETGGRPDPIATGTPEAALLHDIETLVTAAMESDGNPPLSEQTLIDLRAAPAEPNSLLVLAAYDGPETAGPSDARDLAGVAVVVGHGDSRVLELVVHPQYRNQGVGALLVDKLREAQGLERLQAWSHGNSAAAAELAERYGFVAVRELWRMRLVRDHAPVQPLPEPSLPDGVTLRTFVPGRDEAPWLTANAAAFAHHREQGSTTLADLQARMAEPWFDPAGFFLAAQTDARGNEQLLGFHWTKIHPRRDGHPAIGEVYVVGVTPAAQGMGLGKALTVAGIRHLQSASLQAIMLYVDADNAAAVALYRKLGFTRWDADVMYAPAPG